MELDQKKIKELRNGRRVVGGFICYHKYLGFESERDRYGVKCEKISERKQGIVGV